MLNRTLLAFSGFFALLGNLSAQSLTVPNGQIFFISTGTTVTSTSGSTSVGAGGTFTVNGEYQTVGNFTVNASGTLNATQGTLTFNGSSAQTVEINGGELNSTVKNVKVGSSASVTLAQRLAIQGGTNHGTLTVANGGVLTTGGNLVLNSNANGTAVVAQGSSSGGYISGNATVERFIPASRAFRLLSPSVTTTTSIRANWQENGGTTAGLGTHITGSGGSRDGFDVSGTNNPSLFSYNVSTATGSWTAVANTNSNTLTAGSPLRILVRGDRSMNLFQNDPDPNNTTLRAIGTIGQGDKIISGLNTNANGFTFIGNPFPCPVDMSAVMLAAANVNTSSYTVWDPNVGTRGAYVSVNISNNNNASGSAQNKFLQSGQACFVQTAASGTPTIRFNEAHKASASTQTNVFRQIPPFSTLHLTLYQTDSFENKGRALDGLEINFDGEMNTDFDARDSRKVVNPDENISVFVGDQFCAIDSRNLPETSEIIDVRISQMRHGNYTIMANFFSDLGVPAYLIDRHTQQYHALNAIGATRIDFDNDKSTSATANQRFALVFEKTNNIASTATQAGVVYPNPVASDKVVHATFIIDSWTLFDLTGKQIAGKQNHNDTKIELPMSLSPGSYTLKLNNKGAAVSQLIVIN